MGNEVAIFTEKEGTSLSVAAISTVRSLAEAVQQENMQL